MKKKNKKWFNYLVIVGLLLIPFMYSFFYLKAYWDPYGNMKDIPVAIVNLDEGKNDINKGKDLVLGLKNKEALNISSVASDKALEGLSNKKYYAVITIPKNFTSDLLSASSNDKKTATITYSPNQKTNYLASQIISRVVIEVEKEVRSGVSKEVVSSLADNLNGVPRKVSKIDDALGSIQNGTKSLNSGALALEDGSLNAYNGSLAILNGLNSNINLIKQTNAVDYATLNLIKNNASTKVQNEFTDEYKYQIGKQAVLQVKENYQENLDNINNSLINYGGASNLCPSINEFYPDVLKDACKSYTYLSMQINELNNEESILYKTISSTAVTSAMTAATNTSEKVSVEVAKEVAENAKEKSINSLNTLSTSLTQLSDGLLSIKNGTNSLQEGTSKLNSGVILAKNEVQNSIKNTNDDLKKLDNLENYTSNPVKIEEKDVNQVTEYGTAFSPFFISIALWVGSLMLFIILYYDADDRFKLFSRNNENRLKRTFAYLGLAIAQGVVLGILLKIGLNFNITNYFLYFISLIFVALLFESIMEFLIVNFKDVGKFIALILLVLQLAAAGGTFPIETVSTGFRKLFNFLPMKYTIDLFKESLISIEGSLLSKSLIIVMVAFIIIFTINVVIDIKKMKKTK